VKQLTVILISATKFKLGASEALSWQSIALPYRLVASILGLNNKFNP